MKHGNILKEVWLNKENVTNAYAEIDRIEIKKVTLDLVELLEKIRFNKQWIEEYRKDMINYLKIKNKPNSLLPIKFSKDIIKVLKEIDEGNEILKRVLSIRCFGDSKYFEKNIENIIVRIIKKYLLIEDVIEEYNNEDILLEVRNFKISRNNRILWRLRIYN